MAKEDEFDEELTSAKAKLLRSMTGDRIAVVGWR
jgi:hypothetical protein